MYFTFVLILLLPTITLCRSCQSYKQKILTYWGSSIGLLTSSLNVLDSTKQASLLSAKQLNPKRSNRRWAIQWYFPCKWVISDTSHHHQFGKKPQKPIRIMSQETAQTITKEHSLTMLLQIVLLLIICYKEAESGKSALWDIMKKVFLVSA